MDIQNLQKVAFFWREESIWIFLNGFDVKWEMIAEECKIDMIFFWNVCYFCSSVGKKVIYLSAQFLKYIFEKG